MDGKVNDAVENARKKLDAFLVGKKGEQNRFLVPIVEHLSSRVLEDEGLAQDVLKEGKTAGGLMEYLRKKARAYASGNCVAVPDTDVYEWAEDYIRAQGGDLPEKEQPEKPATEKSVPKAKPDKKTVPKAKPEKKTEAVPSAEQEDTDAAKPEEPAVKPKKEKKAKNEIDGQMSLFDMMGI